MAKVAKEIVIDEVLTFINEMVTKTETMQNEIEEIIPFLDSRLSVKFNTIKNRLNKDISYWGDCVAIIREKENASLLDAVKGDPEKMDKLVEYLKTLTEDEV